MDTSTPARKHNRQQFSNRVSQIFAGIEATAFTASILVLHALLLFAVPQTKDIIAQQNHIWSAFSLQSLFSIFSLGWFSIMCWWTARHVLDQVNQESDRPLDSWLLRWLPLCYGVLPALFLLLSAFLRGLGEVMLTSVLVITAVSPLLLASSRLKHMQLLAKLKLNHQAFWFWVTLLVTLLISLASIFSLFQTAEVLQAFATLHLGLAGLLFGMTVFIYLLAGLLTRTPVFGFLFEPPVPVLTLAITLAILIACFVPSDNHGVRRCLTDTAAAQPCPQAADYQQNGYAFADLPSAWQAYVRQLHQLYPEPAAKRKMPVFFVASQGGGLRASYWTGVVLSELEHRYPGFHRHVFATAGVSGGAVGNTFYAAQLAEQHRAGTQSLAPVLSYRIGRDYLSPVTTSFLNNDLLFRFVPVWFDPYQQDRASILEQSWERGFSCRERGEYCPAQEIAPWQGLAEPLQQVYRRYATDQSKWLPLLMNLGTVQELGVPVITAPWPTIANDFPGSFDVYNLLQCQQHSALKCDIRLSTAALNSARFPFVTPAGSLNYDHASGLTRNPPVYPGTEPTATPTEAMPYGKKLHIIDGGYFDNFGASTLLQLVNRLSSDQRFSTASDRFDFVPVILVLTNDPKMDASIPTSAAELPVNPHSMFANEILAPLQGLLGIWDGHANAALKDLIQRYPFHQQTPGSDPLAAQTFVIRVPSGEAYDNLPLGWWLSEESKQLMDQLVCPATQQPPSSQIDTIIGLLPVQPATAPVSPYCH